VAQQKSKFRSQINAKEFELKHDVKRRNGLRRPGHGRRVGVGKDAAGSMGRLSVDVTAVHVLDRLSEKYEPHVSQVCPVHIYECVSIFEIIVEPPDKIPQEVTTLHWCAD
jgi:hypothetical protein